MAEGDTLLNAIIGGIASIVLSFVPFAPILGGAVAGYLEGGERSAGVRIGIYAGIVAAIPLAAIGILIFAVFGALTAFVAGEAAVFAFVVLFIVVLAAVYVVGLSALGGWLGNYVKYDTDLFE